MRIPILFITAILLVASVAHGEDSTAKATFDELKTLVGDWKSSNLKSATSINYRLIANGSALVETWTMSPSRGSMTVYTMDGKRLIATHYCPQGNAPRLELISTGKSGVHYFLFFDGSNIQDASSSHEHAFSISIEHPGRLVRSETYISNGSTYDPVTDKGQSESFLRLN
ncbi:MAG TPA: hypothetical protein VK629_06180 [Steroidobacteraceae bacterium]|nr:hypothetical protein [Steroidobacteraceae bacterium]